MSPPIKGPEITNRDFYAFIGLTVLLTCSTLGFVAYAISGSDPLIPNRVAPQQPNSVSARAP